MPNYYLRYIRTITISDNSIIQWQNTNYYAPQFNRDEYSYVSALIILEQLSEYREMLSVI